LKKKGTKEYNRYQFLNELSNRIFKAKSVNDLFTRCNQLCENVINRGFAWKFPDEKQNLPHTTKIDRLRKSGWLPNNYSTNLKIINQCAVAWKHDDEPTHEEINKMTIGFVTPFRETMEKHEKKEKNVQREKTHINLDRFADGLFNTILNIHSCVIEKSDTFPNYVRPL